MSGTTDSRRRKNRSMPKPVDAVPQCAQTLGTSSFCPPACEAFRRSEIPYTPFFLAADQKKFAKRMSISTRPSLPPALESGPKHAKLFDCLSEIKVCSGHEITMNTDDPHNKPLPSVELLQNAMDSKSTRRNKWSRRCRR
ncbi:hypothetical protein BDW71DRAFT_193081 [Aspergillus fruticulosus]